MGWAKCVLDTRPALVSRTADDVGKTNVICLAEAIADAIRGFDASCPPEGPGGSLTERVVTLLSGNCVTKTLNSNGPR